MGGLEELLTNCKQKALAQGELAGLFHILIGRKIEKADGKPLSSGITWRELARLMKKVRWDREAVRELGLDPAALPPRDRERFWYSAITLAYVDSPKAVASAERLAPKLEAAGYRLAASRGKAEVFGPPA